MDKTSFYNSVYKGNPHKWESSKRDKFAFDILSNYFDNSYPKYLLDIGCGNGHTMEYFSKQWPNTHYVGLDISTEAIKLAQTKMPQAYFVQSSFEQADFMEKYDCIILLGVLEHFEDLSQSIKKLRSLSSGICYIEVPNCIAYPASEHIEGFRPTAIGTHQEEWHLFRPTWEKYLIDAGCEIVSSITGYSQPTEFVWLIR
jgi:trans-aconitate methyltransferase